jgi:hypothetical protein
MEHFLVHPELLAQAEVAEQLAQAELRVQAEVVD